MSRLGNNGYSIMKFLHLYCVLHLLFVPPHTRKGATQKEAFLLELQCRLCLLH